MFVFTFFFLIFTSIEFEFYFDLILSILTNASPSFSIQALILPVLIFSIHFCYFFRSEIESFSVRTQALFLYPQGHTISIS